VVLAFRKGKCQEMLSFRIVVPVWGRLAARPALPINRAIPADTVSGFVFDRFVAHVRCSLAAVYLEFTTVLPI
jgi:hypothetical protein